MTFSLNKYRKGTGAFPPEPSPPITKAKRVAVVDYPLERRVWAHGPLLDQGGVGACAAFATTNELTAEPFPQLNVSTAVGNAHGLNLYQRARVLSGWPPMPLPGGVNGSAVFRNMEACIARGLYSDYELHTASNLSSVAAVCHELVTNGPVILSALWVDSFWQTKANGIMRYKPSPKDQGWHAVCMFGFDPAKSLPVYSKITKKLVGHTEPQPMVCIFNSWGDDWGAKQKPRGVKRTGVGWLSIRIAETMFANNTLTFHAPTERKPVNLAAVLAANPDPTVS